MLFAINNLKEGFSSYYKNKEGFSKRSRSQSNYYNKRGKGAFTSTNNNCLYPDF